MAQSPSADPKEKIVEAFDHMIHNYDMTGVRENSPEDTSLLGPRVKNQIINENPVWDYFTECCNERHERIRVKKEELGTIDKCLDKDKPYQALLKVAETGSTEHL